MTRKCRRLSPPRCGSIRPQITGGWLTMSNDLYTSTYNPDVLSCIANLSNDEVFTPPEVANAMLDLLPQELFRDPNTKFLDPACKSGVFLRETAKRPCTARNTPTANTRFPALKMCRATSGLRTHSTCGRTENASFAARPSRNTALPSAAMGWKATPTSLSTRPGRRKFLR